MKILKNSNNHEQIFLKQLNIIGMILKECESHVVVSKIWKMVPSLEFTSETQCLSDCIPYLIFG